MLLYHGILFLLFILYLQEECRDIKCSPGRIYTGEDCSGLFLSWTDGVYYGLAVKITFTQVVSHGRIPLHEVVHNLINILYDSLRGVGFGLLDRYNFVVDKPCKPDHSIDTVGRFHMYLYHVINIYSVNRNDVDAKLVTLVNYHTSIKFDQFMANFMMKNDWLSTDLPKLRNLIFPRHHCKYLHPAIYYSNRHDLKPGHVFLIDKYLLCPQIVLTSNEYRIVDGSNKLRLLKSKHANAYTDFTVGIDNEVRVCVSEYDFIMTSTSVTHAASCTLAIAIMVFFEDIIVRSYIVV